MRALVGICLLAAGALVPGELAAQDTEALRKELEQMRKQFETMKDGYEKAINQLSDRLKTLESRPSSPAATPAAATPGTPTPVSAMPSPPATAETERRAGPSSSLTPAFSMADGLVIGHEHGPRLRLGANIDLLGTFREFAAGRKRTELSLREVELAVEAQVAPWLHAFVFLSRADGEPFDIEEAAATAHLPWDIQLRAGKSRVEFGYLNTVHEPERPQVSLPLPIVELLGEEQLREVAVTVGRAFDLGGGHRAGLSAAIWNGDNDVAFNGASGDKAFAGKLYYGFQSDAFAYQVGASAFTGRNDERGRLTTNTQALDMRWFLDPSYNKGYDYPSRFSFFSEILFNQRELEVESADGGSPRRRRNDAVGGWAVADYQFLRAHHVGVGVEYTQGLLDRSRDSTAYSAHYTWYYTPHSRIQLQARHLRGELTRPRSGWELNLQWNIVLGPHSERPFLAILPFEVER